MSNYDYRAITNNCINCLLNYSSLFSPFLSTSEQIIITNYSLLITHYLQKEIPSGMP